MHVEDAVMSPLKETMRIYLMEAEKVSLYN